MPTAVVAEVDEALARLDAALDEVAALPLDGCTDDEVLEVWRRMERHRRRQSSAEHGVIAQVETRSLGARSSPATADAAFPAATPRHNGGK